LIAKFADRRQAARPEKVTQWIAGLGLDTLHQRAGSRAHNRNANIGLFLLELIKYPIHRLNVVG